MRRKKVGPMQLTPEQATVVAEHFGLAVTMARRYGDGPEKDNLDEEVSMACEAMCNAMLSYNPDDGRFTTYATRAIYWAFAQRANERSGKKGRWETSLISLDETVGDEDDCFLILLKSKDNPYEAVETKIDMEALASKLTMRERQVLCLLMEGYSLTDIGKQMGCTAEYIRQVRNRVGEKVQEANVF